MYPEQDLIFRYIVNLRNANRLPYSLFFIKTKVSPHFTLVRVWVSWGPAFYKEGDVGREIFTVVVVSFLFTFVSALVLRYCLFSFQEYT